MHYAHWFVVSLCLTGCATQGSQPAEPAEPSQLSADPDADALPVPERFVSNDAPKQTMRINVDLEQVELSEVMEQIGRRVGVTILVDAKVQERVTVTLRDIGWRDAVDVIAKMTRTEVEERPGDVLVLAYR